MLKNSANEIRNLFLQGEQTACSIARFYLDRIAKFDPQIGAFLRVFEERVMQQAEILDKKRAANQPLGKLAAIPEGIKDKNW